MKKKFVIGQCYEDSFGHRYFCVDLDCFGNATLLPCRPLDCVEFPSVSISEFKIVSYSED